MPIKYLVGDATDPCVGGGLRVIPHIVNNKGGFGSGFVLSLNKRWKEPKEVYKKWYSKFKENDIEDEKILGLITIVPVASSEENPLYVVNMCSQNGYKSAENPRPVSYSALIKCLHTLSIWLYERSLDGYTTKISIHMPKIGSGLGGGDFNIIEEIILGTIGEYDIYVYDLKEEENAV